jgi:hypothetical protein
MRAWRILTNCLVAGVLVAAYLAVLFLHLNPHFPLRPGPLIALVVPLVVLYGLHAAVASYLLIGLRQMVAAEPISPGWLSLRVLAWLSALAAGLAALLMWLNLQRFGPSLEETAVQRMMLATGVLAVVALALLTLAVVHYSFGRRGNWLSATLLGIGLLTSLGFPVVLRGPATERPLRAFRLDVPGWTTPSEAPARVLLVAIDGASLEYLVPSVAEGRLPHFGRLLDEGASLHLATIRPTQPAPVWTTVATGKYPWKHGIRSAALYEVAPDHPPLELLPDLCFAHALAYFGLLAQRPVTAASLAAQPLWSMLSRFGVSVGVAGWPVTYPVQPVLGYLVSDRLHVGTSSLLGSERAAVVYPADALDLVEAPLLAELADEAFADAESVGRAGRVPTRVPTARDRVYARVAEALRARFRPRFTAVRYQGLDEIAHWDLPGRAVGGREAIVQPAGAERGRKMAEYYRFLDEELGAALAALGPEDLLLVVSGFGIEPAGYLKRWLARALGDPEQVGSHEDAPDGFLLAFGASVEPGRRPRGAIVDVAPTILYYLGVPVARDLDGYVRTDLFRRAVTAARPITYIPTYER